MHQEKTEPRSCASELQSLGFYWAPPMVAWADQEQGQGQHCLYGVGCSQPTLSQPGLFQHIFPGSQFKTNPNHSSALEIMLKRIAFSRVQWTMGVPQTRPEPKGTNAIVPYPMEAVGYKHRDGQRWGWKGGLRSRFSFFFHQARLTALPCLAWWGTLGLLKRLKVTIMMLFIFVKPKNRNLSLIWPCHSK